MDTQIAVHSLNSARRRLTRIYHQNPLIPDMMPRQDAINAWPFVTCAYSLIEQSLKCLLRVRNISYAKSTAQGHRIDELFGKLPGTDQHPMRIGYRAYQSLHNYIAPLTVDDFLKGMGRDYNAWRYLLIEDQQPAKTHVGAMLEIASAVADILCAHAFTDHGLFHVGKRIRTHVAGRMLDTAYKSVEDVSVPSLGAEDLNQWLHLYRGCPITAFADLVFRHSNALAPNSNLPESVWAAHTRLLGSVEQSRDLDVAHFLDRAREERLCWDSSDKVFRTSLSADATGRETGAGAANA